MAVAFSILPAARAPANTQEGACSAARPVQQVGDQLAGSILLQEVPGVVDPVQGGVRDVLVQPPAVLRREVLTFPPPRAGAQQRSPVGYSSQVRPSNSRPPA